MIRGFENRLCSGIFGAETCRKLQIWTQRASRQGAKVANHLAVGPMQRADKEQG
jgi:hypothetical protein